MSVATSPLTLSESQNFILPGRHSWEDFKTIQAAMEQRSGLRITYFDEVIEFMTLGEYHESIKTIIGFLIEYYLFSQGIEFFQLVVQPVNRGRNRYRLSRMNPTTLVKKGAS
ncbi:hypothetical protein NON20_09660 [Synechocystis sp. B12]|nr:hypothetical protein NON20_09660 [Synechocystis sp. B12]